MSGWHWDETLFRGAAQFYERGRLPYARGLAEALASSLPADGHGRLLDVGCGPGSIALRVASQFGDVVGIDPDPGMLHEARRLAAERGIHNAEFAQARGEDLPCGLGTFDAVTFASSFHWMDRDQVAAIVRGMLNPAGAVVQVDTVRGAPQPGPHPPAPQDAIRRLVQRYLGPARRAGRSSGFVSPDNEARVWRDAGFTGPQKVRVSDGRVLDRTADDVIAWTLSMSWSAPHLFGDQLPDFVADLRVLLDEASPAGVFSARVPDTELLFWRS